jgi:type IV pilus assembly protein PilF
MFRLFFIALMMCSFLVSCAGTKRTEEENAIKADLNLQIAMSYIKSGNYPLALKQLLIAEELNPKSEVVQVHLGFVYYLRESYELAEKHYQKALRLKPDFSEAKNLMARMYIDTNRYNQAEELLQQIIQDLTYQDFPKAYGHYGLLEFKRKKYSAAVPHLKKSLERDRENCETNVLLGRSYLEMDQLALAVPQLDKSIPFCMSLESDEAHYYSAIALYRAGQKSKSRFRFEELTKLFSNGKHYEKAQKMLEIIRKDSP